MNGPAILEFTIRRIPAVFKELLARAEVTLSDVRWVIMHQANEYMLRYLQKKIGIPDDVLLKPAKLDPREWELMQTHTTTGAGILGGSQSPLMKMAEAIALTHHERWDGSGYPFGLVGEKIPLAGRICAICDVYDALTSKRPYKEASTPEE